MQQLIFSNSKINLLLNILTGFIFLVSSDKLFAQLPGSPASGQDAIQICVPAIYDIDYSYTLLSGVEPVGTFRLIMRFKDSNDTELPAYSIIKNHADLDIYQRTDDRWIIETKHTFNLPEESDCEYNVDMVLQNDPDGGTNWATVSGTGQIQYITNWHRDDFPDAGIIAISPEEELVCEGYPVENFTFQDVSQFACVDPSLNNPNSQRRYVQFIYGTDPGVNQGIPNLSIDVNGTKVYLTDENGDPVPNSWTVSPYGNTVDVYSTESGFFEGPVIETDLFPITGSQISFPISFPGIAIDGARETKADDYFEVAIRNWNWCNPWNNSQTNPNFADAGTSTARIVIVDEPDPPTVPSRIICFDDPDRTLTVTSEPYDDPDQIRWYDNPELEEVNIVGTGLTYTQTETAPAVYTYYVTDRATVEITCVSQATVVTLTIRPEITIDDEISGTSEVCVNASDVVFSLPEEAADVVIAGSPDLPTKYIWSVPAEWSIVSGQDSREISVDVGDDAGDYQVSVIRVYDDEEPSCPTNEKTFEVTVFPQPEVSIQGGTTVCLNGDVELTSTITDGTGNMSLQWQSSDDNINFSDIPGANGESYSPPTNSEDETYYQLVVTFDGAGCNVATSNSQEVVVEPDPEVTIQGETTVCLNGDFELTSTVTGGTGNRTLQWQSSGDNIDFSDILGAEGETYNPPTDTEGSIYYQLVVTFDGEGCNVATSGSYEVVVVPLPTSFAGDNANVCSNAPYYLEDAIATNYSQLIWSTDGDGSFDNINNLNPTYTPGPTDILNGSVALTLLAQGLGPCDDDLTNSTSSVTLSFDPVPVEVELSGGQELCFGADAFLKIEIDGGVPPFVVDIDNLTDDLIISGFTHDESISNLEVGIHEFNIISVIDNCGQIFDVFSGNPQTFTIYDQPGATIAGGAIVCLDGDIELTSTITGGTGNRSLQWQSSDDNINFSDIPGADGETYNPTTTDEGTTYYQLVATFDGEECNVAISSSQEVVVEPDPEVIVSGGATVCIGGDVELTSNITGGTGNMILQWQSSSDNVNFTDITGADGESYNPPTTNEGTTYYQLVVTFDGIGCNVATSNTQEVVVEPDPEVTISGGAIVCIGGDVELTSNITGGTGNMILRWQSSDDNINFSNIPGADGEAYNPPTTDEGTTFYQLVATFDGEGCNVATSNTQEVVVEPDPEVTISGGAIVCIGGDVELTSTITGGTGNMILRWQSSDDNINFSNIPGADGEAYNPPTTDEGTTYYQLVATFDGEGCNVATSNTQEVVVVSAPQVTISGGASVCQGGVVELTSSISGGTGNRLLQWQSSSDNINFADIPGANGESYNPQNSAEGTAYYQLVVNFDGEGCNVATSNSQEVVIESDPEVTISGGATVCIGGDAELTSNITGGTGNSTLQWQSSTDNADFSDIPEANAESYNPQTNSEGTTYYQLVVTFDGAGCNVATSNSQEVVVVPDPTSFAGNDDEICGNHIYFLESATATNYSQLIWSTDGDGSFDNTSILNPTYAPGPNDISNGSVTLTLLARGIGPCDDDLTNASSSIELIVRPVPERPVIAGPIELCEGESGFYRAQPYVSGSSWVWDWDTDGPGETMGAVLNEIAFNFPEAGTQDISVYEINEFGCESLTEEISVVVGPKPDTEWLVFEVEVCAATQGVLYSVNDTPNSTYMWNVPSGSSIESGGDGPDNSSITVNFGNNSGNIRVREINEYNCFGDELVRGVTVNPNPSVFNVTGGGERCADDTEGIAVGLDWSQADVEYTLVHGLTVVQSIIPDEPGPLSFDNQFESGTYTVAAIIPSSGCEKLMAGHVTIDINPLPDIIWVSYEEIICRGDEVTFVANGAAEYEFFVNGSTEKSRSTSSRFTTTTLNDGDVIEVIGYSGKGCFASADPVTMTVNDLPVISYDNNAPEICSGEDTDIKLYSDIPGTTFTWTVDMSVAGMGATLYSAGEAGINTIEQTLANNTGEAQTVNYTVTPWSNDCPGDVLEITVTVKPEVQVLDDPEDIVMCENSDVVFEVTAAGINVYQWQMFDGTDWIDIIELLDIDGAVFSGTATPVLLVENIQESLNGKEFRAVLTGCGGEVFSAEALLTVELAPEIIEQPEPVESCDGALAMFEVIADGTDLTYQWQVSIDGGTLYTNLSNVGVYSGVNTPVLDISSAGPGMNGNIYRTVVTGTCLPASASDGALLTVESPPTITTQPMNDIVCEGGDAMFVVVAGGDDLGFEWLISKDGGVNWDPVVADATYIINSGANSSELIVAGTDPSMNGYRFRAVIDGACPPPVESNAVSLIVNTAPVITMEPDALKTICEDSNTSFSVNATGTALTYQWEVDEGSGFTAVPESGVYSGTQTSHLTIFGAYAGMDGFEYRVIITGVCDPPAVSATGILAVDDRPVVTLHPVSEEICQGEDVLFEFDATGTGLSYRWQLSVDGGTVYNNLADDATYNGVNNKVLEITSGMPAMNNYRYRAVIEGVCPPSRATDVAVLTVNSDPVVTSQPADRVVCEGDELNFISSATGTDIVLQWQVNEGGGFTDIAEGGDYSGTNSTELVITGAGAGLNGNLYRMMVSGICGSPDYSNAASLMIDDLPEITADPADEAICEGGSTFFTAGAAGTNISYQWMVNEGSGWNLVPNTGVYSGANTLTLNIDNAPLSMDGYLYSLRVSGKCSPEAYSQEVTLTVNANPTPSILPDPAAVSIDNVLPLDGNPQGGSGSYVTHLWTGAVSYLDDVNIQNPVFTPSTISDFELTYTVTDSNGCQGEDVVTVTVTSGIDVVLDDVELCADTDWQLTPGASGGSEVYVSHEWTGDGTVYLSDVSIRNPVFHSPDPGVYSLTYTVTDDYATETSETITVTVFERPGTAVTGDGVSPVPLVCGGTELQLNGNPSGGSGTWSVHAWTGQTMALSATDITDPLFSTLVAGTYTMQYRVIDSNGCRSDIEEVQVINDIPNAAFSSDAVPGCTPMEVRFTNNSLDAVAYEWDFGDGSDIVTTEHPVHVFENLTTTIQYYTVRLTAYSENGCAHNTTQTVTVYPGIDSEFTASVTESCSPATIEFAAVPGALEYYWDFGDGQGGPAGPNVVHKFENNDSEDRVYNVRLRTTSFYGCFDEYEMEVLVYATPRAEFSSDPPMQKFPSSTVNFTNMGSTGGGFDYEWDFGDGNTSTAENPVHTYGTYGEFEVTFTVTNENCVNSVTHKITVQPADPVAAFDEISPDCAPYAVTFNNNSLYAEHYRWDFGDGSMSTEVAPTHTYHLPGTYLVRLTAYGPGGQDESNSFITVFVSPVSFFNVAPVYVYVNDQHVATFNQSRDGNTYLWDFGDDNFSNDFEPIHVYRQTGIFDISLEVWTEEGCYDKFVRPEVVEVDQAGEITYPSGFRPGDAPTGGRIDEGADEYQRNRVFMPGLSSMVDPNEYHLVIYNRWGELLFESREIDVGWDGFVRGVKAKQDVYIWKVQGKYTNGENFVMAGDITLLR